MQLSIMLESLVTPKKTVGLACGFACPPTSSLYKYVLFPCPLFFILSFLVESVLHHCVCSFITSFVTILLQPSSEDGETEV